MNDRLAPTRRSLIHRLPLAIMTIAGIVACVHRVPTSRPPLSSDQTNLDLAGTWEVVLRVTERGDVRDSTRRPTISTAVGRMRLSPFHQPSPDPRYPSYNNWPRWIGIIHAPFISLLQAPPFQLGQGRHITQDSLRVGVRIDSGRVRLDMTDAGCSDCGNIEATGTLRRDDIGGRWSQEFFGTGDAGTWSMRRIRDSTNSSEL